MKKGVDTIEKMVSKTIQTIASSETHINHLISLEVERVDALVDIYQSFNLTLKNLVHQYNLDEASTADILEVLAHTLRESFEFSAHYTQLEGLL